MKNCAMKVFGILGLVSFIVATPTTITAPPVSDNSVTKEKDDLKTIFGHCLHKKDVTKCLKNRAVDVIDDIIQSNDPLSVNLFNMKMSLNKNPLFKENKSGSDSSRAFDDIISQKLKNLIESRIIQVKLADDNSDDTAIPSDVNEARKKKGGGKHGTMMMSGKRSSLKSYLLN